MKPKPNLSSRQRLMLGLVLYLGFVVGFRFAAPPLQISALFVYLLALAPALMIGPVLRRIVIPMTTSSSRLLHWEPLAASCALASLCFAPGYGAALLALPWLGFSLGVALLGGLRLMRLGLNPPEELLLNLGLIFLAVGGIWWIISRLGLNPNQFGHPIVFLTAVHFHFAGFASCVISGLSGRVLMRQRPGVRALYLFSLCCSVLGIPLLALGIRFSPSLELLSAGVFALGLLLWSGLTLWQIKHFQRRGAKFLLSLASLSILWSMFWALYYALATYLDQPWVSIPEMGWRHGLWNVFGYAFPALLALCWEHPPARQLIRDIPFSRLFGKWHVGAQFFDTLQPPDSEYKPTGLIESFADYARPDFNPEALPQELRHFYEHTQDYELQVIPEWQWGFRTAARGFHWLMQALGQMVLPLGREALEIQMQSLILPVDDARDGRQHVRAWVRSYRHSGKVVYAAAYSQHRHGEQLYMNIAFPLPWSQLSSILRLDSIPALGSRSALRLSSLPHPERSGDQGVFWVTPYFVVRLPINETIEVWSRKQWRSWPHPVPEASILFARHDMWILGLRCLRLSYAIYPKSQLV